MSNTLAGVDVSKALVRLPRSGVWSAEVRLVKPATLSGAVTLVLGDLTLSGTIPPGRGGAVEGTADYLVRGGAGTWAKPIPAKAYRNDAGVKRSTLLRDAAAAVGERVELAADGAVGQAWVRRAGPAWNLFAALELPWWVDAAGVTQVRARPAGAVAARYEVLRKRPALRWRLLTSDALAPFAPGAVLEGETIDRVEMHVGRDATRIEVWT